MICPNCKENKIPFSSWGKNMTGTQECNSCGQKTKMSFLGWIIVLSAISPWVYFFSMQIAGIDIGSNLHTEFRYLRYGQIPLLLLIIPFCILAGKIGLKKAEK
ncbi:hypothetical protein [Zooshikella harenae]|uniref:GATA-type domain-containing protein n=1 Tax=Zooshikella harenae TaxID=2827238 RepID=A0ABS5ZHT2_9GAMM|nr:hypothetical protein [Zooshikella harenae]MBU2713633.1 hypothetical protein [Zooshikella harenae]